MAIKKKTTSGSAKSGNPSMHIKVKGDSKKQSKKKTNTFGTKPSPYDLGTYSSDYTPQISAALNSITNFKYDPMQDASYQALAKIYGARGNIAAKDTLADAASLNGGMQTSYAVSAAQQARNQYNQELAALIPDLEANAYNRAQTTYNALMDADNTAYGRFRDSESDRQWRYGMNYDAYRDAVADEQWKKQFAYQKQRDKVADQQWAKEYALSKKGSSGGGGGGGGRRSYGGGGGGGYTGDTTGGDNTPTYDGAKQYIITKNTGQKKQLTTYKKKGSPGGRMVK